MHPNLAIVIPVYNRGKHLADLLQRITHVLNEHSITHEVIFSDDCSTDDSWDVIQSLAAQYPLVAGVHLPVNMGQYAATIAGLQQVRAPVCITMDDDFEHLPEQLPVLYAALLPSLDLVYAQPHKSRNLGYYVLLANLARIFMAVCCRAPYIRWVRTFRVMRTEVYPWRELTIHSRLTVDGLLGTRRLRAQRISVPYGQSVRAHSTYNIVRLVRMISLVCLTGLLRRPLAAPQEEKMLVDKIVYVRHGA